MLRLPLRPGLPLKRGSERDMTIAAGFFYKGGLLICADTQATGATFKIEGSKLLPHEYDDKTQTIFATVGQVSYARMGVQLAEASIGDLPKGKRTLHAIHEKIIEQTYSLFVKHLYQHPSWAHDENLRVQFLVGVWSAADGQIGFFKTEDTAVERLYGYECLGSGAPLAHFLIRPKYQRREGIDAPPSHDENYVRELAAESFEGVKSHDPNCGGLTQWMTLSNNGERRGGAMPLPPPSSPTSPPVHRGTKRGR
jgi:hypothetical protein